ncbi:MAG: hemerythrin domain-containing protein [Deltaproteobacteria bacterium]|nr:hemerythrin domain-containing protein [Deltaproteobacteria bacterium]
MDCCRQEPVDPSEARARLLAQHEELRGIIDGAEEMTARLVAGKATGDEVRRKLAELDRALHDHNAEEETILEPLLRTVDAWGPVRIEQMLTEHAREHGIFRQTLDEIVASPPSHMAGAIRGLVADLRRHIEHEERSFLNPELLKDDLVTVTSCS